MEEESQELLLTQFRKSVEKLSSSTEVIKFFNALISLQQRLCLLVFSPLQVEKKNLKFDLMGFLVYTVT